jgi:hypothetical protein
MKNFFAVAPVLLTVLVTLMTVTNADAKTKAHKNDAKAELGTSFKFSGSTLRGKYNDSLGATATVESDKYLDDLLGGRKSFEDRNQKEAERN